MAHGVTILKGPSDWQILQQSEGFSAVFLSGTWALADDGQNPQVYVRLLEEETGAPVLWWQPAEMLPGQRWQHTLERIPAGGLYRLETCLRLEAASWMEWSARGDTRHHLGCGDIFVIAGQSNSAGYGRGMTEDTPEPGVHLLRNNGCWDMAMHPMNDSTGTLHPVNMEGGNPGHSPWLTFARRLRRTLGYPIGLVQTALGGSPLSAWNPSEEGHLYRNMTDCIRAAGGTVRGVLWYQGCSDTTPELSRTYRERFANMVSCLRDELQQPDLPFLTVQLNRLVTPADPVAETCWSEIRETQRQLARALPQVFVIPSLDCPLSDAIHNSPAGNSMLGMRAATLALQEIYGLRIGGRAPDLASATVAGRSLRLTFAPVLDRIYPFEVPVTGLPFVCEDDTGTLPLTGYAQPAPDTLVLDLGRAPEGRCRVHCAPGQNPAGILPVDTGTYLPLLAFYDVTAERSE